MTKNADLKALVRERMERTGENYTTARAALLDSPPVEEHQATVPSQVSGPHTPDQFVDKTVRSFFDGDRLRSIPTKRRARVAVLLHLLRRFEVGRDYPEREVNDILRTAHDDISTLRRELVDYRYLLRADGIYRVTEVAPVRDANEAQEVPADEAARLAALPRA
ncbi:MAG: DUF2087 domain-containing protein [Actinomycetia bacterium]|nr:DUF2087 domain-containing protein [Actinomycetes bacterium]